MHPSRTTKPRTIYEPKQLSPIQLEEIAKRKARISWYVVRQRFLVQRHNDDKWVNPRWFTPSSVKKDACYAIGAGETKKEALASRWEACGVIWQRDTENCVIKFTGKPVWLERELNYPSAKIATILDGLTFWRIHGKKAVFEPLESVEKALIDAAKRRIANRSHGGGEKARKMAIRRRAADAERRIGERIIVRG